MEHKYEKYWEHNGCKVIECQSCGFRHVYPIPEEGLRGYYDEKYYSEVKPFDYGAVSSASVRERAEAVHRDAGYKAIYDKVAELKLTSETGMLDIGCGNDLLALYFKYSGWQQASVIEPNVMAAGYLEQFGLSVINDYFENIPPDKLKGTSFINLQFVLEHLKDPVALLNKTYEMLVPGGIIRICVPNDFSEGQLAFKDYYNEAYRWIALPDHINYFDFESLSGLLSRTGFTELYRTTSFPLEFLLMGGMNYYLDKKYKDQVGPFVYNFESSFRKTGREQLLNRFYEELSKLGMGRSIYMYAMKK